MSSIEELGLDKCGNKSSLEVNKHGYRAQELNGKWTYVTSCETSQTSACCANSEWAKKLISLGFRIGKFYTEGCIEYYVYEKNVYL